ncbi:hypothetical protein BYT27DRAFT_7239444 [Phlegmacium glaucopus]|nr:hypothetical protein BYT27DRAFT_7239444 [Phlegmacium glaucopus]
MASRPDYQIYEDCLIRCHHGFPQWRADPGPIEDSIIKIGDVGYCSEGKFNKLMHLNLREVCAGHDGIKSLELRFPGPIFYQLTGDLRFRGRAEVGSGYTGLPVGGGATAGVQNHFHEASVLRLEDERAVYSYLDKRSTENIGKYALKHYQSWLTLESFRGVSVEEMVVILGTYINTLLSPLIPYGFHMEWKYSMESIWNPPNSMWNMFGLIMESIWNGYIPWNPCGIHMDYISTHKQ